MVVFFLVNLEPNLKKLAISQLDMRSPPEQLESWLEKNGYRENFFLRYGRFWASSRNSPSRMRPARWCRASGYCNEAGRRYYGGVLQGDFRLFDQVQDEPCRQNCSRRSAPPVS